jgi:hypothetical protein
MLAQNIYMLVGVFQTYINRNTCFRLAKEAVAICSAVLLILQEVQVGGTDLSSQTH